MRKYNKYLVAGLVLSLLSFSTNALANEENNSSTDTVSKYSNDNNDFSVNSVVEHDNDFCITSIWKDYWKKVEFNIDSYSVTPGQPFSGIDPKNQPLDKTCFRVRSGRKRSKDVMKWVDNLLHGYSSSWYFNPAISNTSSKAVYERSLTFSYANFAFIGTLTLKNQNNKIISCKNILIGQSSDIIKYHNVWFLYSNMSDSIADKDGIKPETKVALKCDMKGNKIYIHVSSGSYYSSKIETRIFNIFPIEVW